MIYNVNLVKNYLLAVLMGLLIMALNKKQPLIAHPLKTFELLVKGK